MASEKHLEAPELIPLDGKSVVAVLKVPDAELSDEMAQRISKNLSKMLPGNVVPIVIPASWSFEVFQLDDAPKKRVLKMHRKDAPWHV